jgi:hypothetical protein
MDDNIWEYPFGELEEDEEIFFQTQTKKVPPFTHKRWHLLRLNLEFLVNPVNNRIIF